MIPPRGLQGRSSRPNVYPADGDRPKTQSYEVFVDALVVLERAVA